MLGHATADFSCSIIQILQKCIYLFVTRISIFLKMLATHFIFHFDYTLQSKLQNENTCLCLASFRSTLVDKVSKKQCSDRQAFCPKSHENQLPNKEQNQSCCYNHRNEQFRKTQTTVSVFFGLVTESRE